MKIEKLKEYRNFNGFTRFYKHDSMKTKTEMKFSTFEPNQKIEKAIIWLSGLTCTDENFITKAGSQNYLKNTNTMIICPDTSPRGLELPSEHESYDFGSGAGFYINATSEGYQSHYKMYDYIAEEIIGVLNNYFGVKKISIMGHSMGGHGALVLGLREQKLFTSVSAFSPIVNPIKCDWGKKAFQGYFSDETRDDLSKKYDATELIKSGIKREDLILIDQGLSDEFFQKQLLTKNIINASKEVEQSIKVVYREGYDHSYYYIASFIGEHIDFHLRALN